MITGNVKSLMRRLNPLCARSMEAAAGFCISWTHYEVALEHLLAKLLEDTSGDLSSILRHFDIERGRLQQALVATLERLPTGNAGRPRFSPILLELIERSWVVASVDFGQNEVRSGILLTALLSKREIAPPDEYMDILASISLEELHNNFSSIVDDSSEERHIPVSTPFPGATPHPMAPGAEGQSALDLYTLDFTGKARAGEIDPVFARDHEIRQMIDILTRRRKNNPILVGEPGTGKTAIVEGLALRVVSGDVPDILKDIDIRGLDLGLLQAGAGMKGEFENRLKSVIAEVTSSPKPIITFIDEAHTLIGAGGTAGGSDAANLLKPALARGELRTVAATTWSEYKKYFEKDAALERRFQMVKVEEPSETGAAVMLRGLKEKYESYHGVRILDEAVTTAARLSDRYISGRFLPDKAVDLIDTAAARVKIVLSSKPSVVEDLERRIQNLEIEMKARRRDVEEGSAPDDDAIKDLEEELAKLREESEGQTQRWERERAAVERVQAIQHEMWALRSAEEHDETAQAETAAEATTEETPDLTQEETVKDESPDATVPADEEKEDVPDEDREAALSALRADLDKALQELEKVQGKDPMISMTVDTGVIAKVVSDWTGIPVGNMIRDEASGIIELEERLSQRVLGQDYAIAMVASGLRAAKARLKNPEAPIGVFLLVGPSGVGKTELGLAIADVLFGGERFTVTINMSEYMEKHTVSRLIGSPPGYVGFGEGGILTEAVRQRPYSVVLMDEVEKSSPDVMNLFYQVFDKGQLSDGEGRAIDFKNTVLLMTSNLGSDIIENMCSGDELPEPEEIIEAIKPGLRDRFRPALLARMIVVPFYPISAEVMARIVELKLAKLAERLEKGNQMALDYDPAVVERIAERCTEVETGARNIDHIMQKTLLPEISVEILTRMQDDVMPSKLHLGINDEGSFVYQFS